MERRTRIWIGLGTALLVGGTGVERAAAIARESTTYEVSPKAGDPSQSVVTESRIHIAQAETVGEGGPNEGGGPVLGMITEFRLSSNDPNAFTYDARAQVEAYADLVAATYDDALASATTLQTAVAGLVGAPADDTLAAAREAWLAARAAYLKSEAYLFYAGPVDGVGGPFPRLNQWPVDPTTIDGIIADNAQSLNFRAVARLNKIDPPVKITTGLHVLEYLLWGSDGRLAADDFGTDARRGEYAEAVTRLLVNDLSVLAAAWAPGSNNYRASVLAMDQRNALGRALNGMTVLLGYEVPLRRIGAGLFPANENFQPSPFSQSSAEDNRYAFEGARDVYDRAGFDVLVRSVDAALADKIAAGFDAAAAALGALDAPYERFLAPPTGSAERATANAAVKALTNLARDLRTAGNRLGILVVVPGM
jgi:putative iron-regulated protein